VPYQIENRHSNIISYFTEITLSTTELPQV